jgi:Heterokaryon incompatibility protein (HET)
MAPYVYLPLDDQAKEIRVVTLHPGIFSEEIRISLENVILSTDNRPDFEALSYVWGSTRNFVDVKVEPHPDMTLSLTRNLVTALPYLRYPDKARVLWVDALCIDQQSLIERSRQVERMGDIYQLASRVIVWLGPENENSDYAMQLIDSINSKIEIDWTFFTMKPTLAGAEEQWADRWQPLPYDAKELSCLYSLLHRSWFERLWIRQEIRLANSEAIVMCGFTTIAWQTFRNAIFCLRNKSKKKECLGDKATPFNYRLEMVYQLCDIESPVPFGRHLRQTKLCKCSDPRDRIYAMLNTITQEERKMAIKPDYSQTVGEVYQNVVLRWIDHFKDLKLLAFCEMQDEPATMPTWIADWSVPNIAEPLRVPWAHAGSTVVSHYKGNGILSVAGVFLATINSVEEVHFVTASAHEIAAGICRPAPDNIRSAPYVGGGTLLDAYCRTFCCDNFGEGFVPSLVQLSTLLQCRETLIAFLDPDKTKMPDMTPGTPAAKLLDWAWTFCAGRSFFTTKEGYIGLAPKAAKPKDEVCVLLGCPSLIVLRPGSGMHYQVVGECYVPGLANGEAILGPISDEYKPVNVYDEAIKDHFPGFLNINTNEILKTDPRLEGLLKNDSGLSDQIDDQLHSRLNPEILRASGISIQMISLE